MEKLLISLLKTLDEISDDELIDISEKYKNDNYHGYSNYISNMYTRDEPIISFNYIDSVKINSRKIYHLHSSISENDDCNDIKNLTRGYVELKYMELTKQNVSFDDGLSRFVNINLAPSSFGSIIKSVFSSSKKIFIPKECA